VVQPLPYRDSTARIFFESVVSMVTHTLLPVSGK